MKKASRPKTSSRKTVVRRPVVREEMRAEYDFNGGVRGKYAGRFAPGGTSESSSSPRTWPRRSGVPEP